MTAKAAAIYHVPSDDPLVFKATFSDFKNIKTRKVMQIILEVPIEAADAALKTLGGVPRADRETWVGVARLDPAIAAQEARAPAHDPRNPPAEPSATKERQKFAAMPLAKQAAIRCEQDEPFRRFLAERLYGPSSGVVLDPSMAAEEVRHICGVGSRRDINDADESGEKWRSLDREYLSWKHESSYEGMVAR